MKMLPPHLDYLQRKMQQKMRKNPTEREEYLLDRSRSIKWMLRGLLFIPITAISDHFYRMHRYTETDTETMLMVFVLVSIIGIIQFPIGLYYWIKNRNQDIEKGSQ